MQKTRTCYIILAVFLGMFGIHNFYAGYKVKAVTQLLVTLLSFGCLGIAIWVWAVIEACTVTEDADGNDFLP